jgi:hypothetical protein
VGLVDFKFVLYATFFCLPVDFYILEIVCTNASKSVFVMIFEHIATLRGDCTKFLGGDISVFERQLLSLLDDSISPNGKLR